MASNNRIIAIARKAPVRAYRWKDRGQAPAGYISGMAVAYAAACRDLSAGDAVVTAIAAPCANDPDHDVLDWYADELAAAGLKTENASERLLCVFAIMLGLGMRESSGKHCEGRDMAADNVAADTAEAGLFQVSYNSIDAHPQLQLLFDRFRTRDDLLATFKLGVHCSASSWTDWGTGAGRDFQAFMKRNPQFAVLYTGLLLRHDRQHWGPINRREAEVAGDAVVLLRAIKAQVEQDSF